MGRRRGPPASATATAMATATAPATTMHVLCCAVLCCAHHLPTYLPNYVQVASLDYGFHLPFPSTRHETRLLLVPSFSSALSTVGIVLARWGSAHRTLQMATLRSLHSIRNHILPHRRPAAVCSLLNLGDLAASTVHDMSGRCSLLHLARLARHSLPKVASLLFLRVPVARPGLVSLGARLLAYPLLRQTAPGRNLSRV